MKLHASGDKWKPNRPHHHAKGASPSGPRPSGGATVPTAVAFIHIPKNAGSTIENWALDHFGLQWGKHAWDEEATRATGGLCRWASWHVPPAVLEARRLPSPYASARARCFLERDRQLLLAVIDASFGTVRPFNKLVRAIFAEQLERKPKP